MPTSWKAVAGAEAIKTETNRANSPPSKRGLAARLAGLANAYEERDDD
jgi:hypothetical protein